MRTWPHLICLLLLLLAVANADPNRTRRHRDHVSASPLLGWLGTYKGSCFQYAAQQPSSLFKCSQEPVTYPQYAFFERSGKTGFNVTYEHVDTKHKRSNTVYGSNGATFANLPVTPLWRDKYGWCIRLDLGGGSTADFRVSITRHGPDTVYLEEGRWVLKPNKKIIECPPKNSYVSVAEPSSCKPNDNYYEYRCISYKTRQKFT